MNSAACCSRKANANLLAMIFSGILVCLIMGMSHSIFREYQSILRDSHARKLELIQRIESQEASFEIGPIVKQLNYFSSLSSVYFEK